MKINSSSSSSNNRVTLTFDLLTSASMYAEVLSCTVGPMSVDSSSNYHGTSAVAFSTELSYHKSVHITLQHYGRDTARRASSSKTALICKIK